MVDAQVVSKDLAAVAKALGTWGASNNLRKALLRSIRIEGADSIAKVRGSAASTLPTSGGLAQELARGKISIRTRLSGTSASVKVRSERGASADTGTLRHPVFKTGRWVSQQVRPGWFTEPLEDSAPEFHKGLERVIDKIRRDIERAGP